MRLWSRSGPASERFPPVKRWARCRLAGIACCLALASAGLAAETREHSLIAVLSAYESAGFSFVYSRDLVRSDLQVQIDLDADLSIPHLEASLERIGFRLQGLENRSGTTTWYVVPPDPESTDGPPMVKGRVLDAQSGRPLSGVRVEIGSQVVFTDTSGWFELPGSGEPPLQVSRSGYQAREVPLEVRLDALLEITLEAETRMEEVVVVSSRYALERSEGASVHTLTAQDFEKIPEFGDDVLRVANHLPGTASIGLSARPYVRGGLQDETLVLFNDVELLEPFHLKDFQSVFSGFNPSVVESVDVYTGGFPVRYGDRMMSASWTSNRRTRSVPSAPT